MPMSRGQERPRAVGQGRICFAVLAIALSWAGTVPASELPTPARRATGAAGAAGASAGSGSTTLPTALVQAYRNNPQLNSQRAATRAVDENVAIALGGYRPRVSGTSSLSEVHLDNTARVGSGNVRQAGNTTVTTLGITATQTKLHGFQTVDRYSKTWRT